MPSIFTRIIQGELPCFKIHETEDTIAFLTLDPIRPGHTLVVPKRELDHFADLDEKSRDSVFRNAQPVARAIRAATDCTRVGLAVQGFEVPHFHLHLIPMWGPEDFDFKKAKRLPPEEMKAIQEKIVGKLKV